MSDRPPLTLGIEEEYLLVERATGALVAERHPGFLEACEAELGERVTTELLQAQIEIGTGVCATVAQARAELAGLRGAIVEIAARFDMAPLACSTHPLADWQLQRSTEAVRYQDITREYQAVARRAVVCGMHVHAGVDDDEQRIRLMGRVVPYLPLFLALSASSPFWRGEETGLRGFRHTIFGSFPRTGIPEPFTDWADWQAFTRLMADTGACPDPTKIWWDLRPSARLPTLELRICEVCTRLEDALALAALYQALLAWLARAEDGDETPGRFAHALAKENKWRAQRWGVSALLADSRRRELVPVATLVDELVATLAEDARALGCAAELERVREIAGRGSSADAQLAIYRNRVEAGASPQAALAEVVRWLADTTADPAA